MIVKGPKLVSSQWKLLTSALSNIAQGIILFSLAAFFVPEAVSLNSNYPRFFALSFLVAGLFMIISAAIIVKKGK